MSLLAAALVTAGGDATAQTVIGTLGSGRSGVTNITSSTTWTNGAGAVDYIMAGLVFVKSPAVLTIDAGTVINGDVAATLIIEPGAQIQAVGTSSDPIVFTSNQPAGNRAPGDWGGIILLGDATENQAAALQIEGGIIPGTFGTVPPALPNDLHNAGTMQYVRIEYAGYRYQINNEVNGLTLGAVGSGTTIDHVQVSYAFDDSFEFFGGTVNAKYLVAFAGTDDDFDTDFGYTGKVQFAVSLRAPLVWDPTGESNGFESDNDATGTTATPRTAPTFVNFSLIGPNIGGPGTGMVTGNKYQYGAVLRRRSQLKLYNSVITGFPGGVSLRDELLQGLENNSLSNTGDNSFASYHGSGTGITAAAVQAYWDATNTPAVNLQGPSYHGITIGSIDAPDFTVDGSSILLESNGASLKSGLDPFFDVTTYRGAFGTTVDWTSGWASFPLLGATGTTSVDLGSGWNLVSVPRLLVNGSLVPTPGSVGTIFPGHESGTINAFNPTSGSYSSQTTVQAGPGYWAYYASDPSPFDIQGIRQSASITDAGYTAAADTGITLLRWVIIGTPSSVVPGPIALGNQVTGSRVNRLEAGTLYGWNGTAYSAPTQLEPGKAYWVLTNGGTANNPGGSNKGSLFISVQQ
jgi:hypothetical protein